MRTIKFRGETIDGTWIIGDFVWPNVILEDKDTNLSLGKLYLNNSSIVIQDTVGQFTGLQDTNGTDVYEGDIVRYRPNNKVYQVVFKDGIFWGEGNNGCGAAAHFFPACEIIGNVFDNSELIKKGGNNE